MAVAPEVKRDSIVVLAKTGRLPTWDDLAPELRKDYEKQHVDLMLSVAREYRMMRLEGFRLMAPQGRWARFWLIEFPTLEGAEAWIDAEMAPPYGLYGYYEYHLARRWGPDYFSTWVTRPAVSKVARVGADSHSIPPLTEDHSSVVALLFSRWLPEADAASPGERGDAAHIELMKSVAREHGLMRLEGFRLIAPLDAWHRAWVVEFPTLAGAEAWMEGELRPPHGRYATKAMYLARKWAPGYFNTWVPRG